MDRKYIENEHVVDRYLSGDLTVREARDFEKYCLDHPEALKAMPIPVRLKARLARRPTEDSETGVFQAIPSSVTRAALEATEDGFDPEEEREETQRFRGGGGGTSRLLTIGLVLALIGALGGVVFYAMQVDSLQTKIRQMERAQKATQMQATSSVQTYRLQPLRGKPAQAQLNLGWLEPPQMLELRIDASQGKYTQFQITIDKIEGGRVMQVRRVTRDSNKELRLALNSSAFGPGEYLLKIDGYTWKGQAEQFGWLRLNLQ
jgi:hypothetical protein